MASLKSISRMGVLLAAFFLGTARGLADSCEDTTTGEACEEQAEASLIQARSQQRRMSVHAEAISQSTVQSVQVGDGSQEVAACGLLLGWLVDAMRDVINSRMYKFLKKEDPLEMSLGSMDKKIRLPGCDTDISISSSLSLSGLSTASVKNLKCSNAECLKRLFVCTEYNVTMDTTVGIEKLVVSGSVDADWGRCSPNPKFPLPPNETISMGFDIMNPSIEALVMVDATMGWSPSGKITDMKILNMNPGTTDNFNCGLNSKLDRWCTVILEWIVTNIWKVLKPLVNEPLLDLVDESFEKEK